MNPRPTSAVRRLRGRAVNTDLLEWTQRGDWGAREVTA